MKRGAHTSVQKRGDVSGHLALSQSTFQQLSHPLGPQEDSRIEHRGSDVSGIFFQRGSHLRVRVRSGLCPLRSSMPFSFPAIAMLKDKAPGSFIVRDSHSFRGAYGLAMKVATPPPSVLHLNKKGKVSWNSWGLYVLCFEVKTVTESGSCLHQSL